MKRDAHAAATGAPHPRLEGGEKVTGRAQYSSDIRLPGQLYARVLRSPLPHARVSRIDTGRAAALPGVHAVLSSANVPEMSWYEGSLIFDRTLRFNGDEVAAVAAESEEIAEDALRLIDVEFEPLAFAVDLGHGARGEPVTERRGDVARGLHEADVVIDETYTTQTALHNALEPHGCTATWEDGTLVLYESTQGIFAVCKAVAEKLELPETRVRVITQHMGGGFGAKQIAWKYSSCSTARRRTSRPATAMRHASACALVRSATVP
jgi:xanthine dehydrogenase YagR molybdenum-binding subunit